MLTCFLSIPLSFQLARSETRCELLLLTLLLLLPPWLDARLAGQPLPPFSHVGKPRDPAGALTLPPASQAQAALGRGQHCAARKKTQRERGNPTTDKYSDSVISKVEGIIQTHWIKRGVGVSGVGAAGCPGPQDSSAASIETTPLSSVWVQRSRLEIISLLPNNPTKAYQGRKRFPLLALPDAEERQLAFLQWGRANRCVREWACVSSACPGYMTARNQEVDGQYNQPEARVFSAVSRRENDTAESVGEVEKERERGIGEYWRNNLKALFYTRGEMYQMELKPDKSKSV
ncbi:unnamed protein product [Arctogadus glacialis]